MIPVSVYASLRHYFDHVAPVADALRSTGSGVLRGVEAPRGRPWGVPLRQDRRGALWLVASGADAQRIRPAPVIYLEHGAGQSYHGDERARRSGSYAGGEGLEHVVLFLCPNESVADRWRAAYPETPAVVVGSPRLDRWHRWERFDPTPRSRLLPPARPRVAVSFHWPNTLCPESQWTLPHYRGELHALAMAVAGAGGELIGHGHPRAWRTLRREWARIGVRPVEDLEQVMAEADVLVVDNSSAGPEFASLGRPIVWLSAPWYRRDVDHGGRFWSWTEGIRHVEDPGQLVPTVLDAMANPDRDVEARAAMVRAVYSATDSHAADRAADAIMEVSCRTPSPPPE